MEGDLLLEDATNKLFLQSPYTNFGIMSSVAPLHSGGYLADSELVYVSKFEKDSARNDAKVGVGATNSGYNQSINPRIALTYYAALVSAAKPRKEPKRMGAFFAVHKGIARNRRCACNVRRRNYRRMGNRAHNSVY